MAFGLPGVQVLSFLSDDYLVQKSYCNNYQSIFSVSTKKLLLHRIESSSAYVWKKRQFLP